MAVIFVIIVTDKHLFAVLYLYPVAVLYGGSISGARLLFLHFSIESLFINGKTVLSADKFGEVKREAVGIEKAESLGAIKLFDAGFFHCFHIVSKQIDTVLQCAEETVFLLFHYLGDEFLLGFQFRVCISHLMNKYGYELKHECSFLIKKGISIANGAAQDATDNVSRFCVAG